MSASLTVLRSPRTTLLVAAAAIFVVAFAARLWPMVRGGGLAGFNNYDDGVNFGGALGLVHGQLPYRDFLWLHPPGVQLALAPFAALSYLTGEPFSFVAARIGWMVLGGVNALLIARLLRPAGAAGAVFGAGFYALFWPAIIAEQTVRLEAVPTACLLAALIILQSIDSTERLARHPTAAVLLAGGLLGVGAATKIWGVAPVLILAGWWWAVRGPRSAGWLVAGAGAATTAICLPFFLTAPGTMWRMVVLDQLGRERRVGVADRLVQITGLGPIAPAGFSVLLVVALAALIAAAGLAWTLPRSRPAVLLLVGLLALLLSTPTWFFHYTALTAPVIAVVAGAALQAALALPVTRAHRGIRAGLTASAVLAVLLLAAFVATASSGQPFPARDLRPAIESGTGCVTSDHPSALILTDMIGRNLARGCPLVVDLGGATHDLGRGNEFSRRGNRAFQEFAIEYLRTGDRAVLARFTPENGWSRASWRTLQTWPVLAESGRFSVREPR